MKGADRWGPVVSERSNKKKGGGEGIGPPRLVGLLCRLCWMGQRLTLGAAGP
jgi:hypothetical protein